MVGMASNRKGNRSASEEPRVESDWCLRSGGDRGSVGMIRVHHNVQVKPGGDNGGDDQEG